MGTDEVRIISKGQELFEQIKQTCRSQHRIGDNAIKYGVSVYVCKSCLRPVVLVSSKGSYRCPECNKWRNRQQRIWSEFEQAVDFRKLEQ